MVIVSCNWAKCRNQGFKVKPKLRRGQSKTSLKIIQLTAMNRSDVRIKSNSCLSVLRTSGVLLLGPKEKLFSTSLLCRFIYLRPVQIKGVNAECIVPAGGTLVLAQAALTHPIFLKYEDCFPQLVDGHMYLISFFLFIFFFPREIKGRNEKW